jgi:GT2 family glycosyltransferase
MNLSIIIVNYNTLELTSNCIRSIYQHVKDLQFEIIVVDNASPDMDADELSKRHPGIKLIKSPSNLGFAKGNNLGLSHATGKYILLLNSDCELINDAPNICYEYMESVPGCGMTTVQLKYPDGKIQYNCRKFRSISWELLEIIPLYLLMSKKKKEELMLHHYFKHDRKVSCDWVWGAYMFFPKEILEKLPSKKLSEDFFMYCEDTLWCWEFKQLGYNIVFLPEGKVMHVHKGSSKSKEKIKASQKMSNQHHLMFMKRIYPDWRWQVFKMIYLSKQALIKLIAH